mmetsp:Transcript_16887/g.23153  ORF Transcript_16887/g.23153 Transcript_16887/m.23153 type:complete len:80 (+) Transcript_16887:103-342(+)
MKGNTTTIRIVLGFVFLGTAVAFVRPAFPRQISALSQYNTKVESLSTQPKAPFDPELDNAGIETDNNIHPARKCAVCIG